MLQRAETAPGFSLARARHLVADLFTPKPWIYWTDLLISTTIGSSFFTIALLALRDWQHFLPGLPFVVRLGIALAAYVICSLAFYRMSMFIHELVHIRNGTMTGFRALWNVFCGIPFLMPSFVYYTHLDHHRRRHYGTENDGEYVSFGVEEPTSIIKHLAFSLLIPILAVTRFLIVGPISWFVPPLRRWVLQRASSMVIDYDYVRPLPTSTREKRIILLQEVLCFAWLVGLIAFPVLVLHRLPIPMLILGYAVSVFILTLNAIRTLGSHRWSNHKHDEMTFVEQLLDSVNVDGHPIIAELWGPIGTRYHALHHLFPGLPYHAMPAAHRRLIKELPAGSPYHQAEEPSLTAALVDLWRRSAAAALRKRVRIARQVRRSRTAAAG